MEAGNFIKENWKWILIIIVLIILYKVLNNLFEGRARKVRGQKRGAKAIDNKNLSEAMKDAKKGKVIFGLKPKEQADIVKSLEKLLRNAEGLVTRHMVSEGKVIAQIKMIITKPDLSAISKGYTILSKRDLYADIKAGLSTDGQKIVFDYINSLPDYL